MIRLLIILCLISGTASGQIINASAPVKMYTSTINIDSNAKKLIDSASITDDVQKSALNTLVRELKDSLIWDSLVAIYPFIGGTESSHKWNLKNVSNTDAAHRIVFSGTWTHNSSGADPNGVNAYANTYYAPSLHAISTSRHMAFYSGEDVGTGRDMGATNGPLWGDNMHIEYIDGSGGGQLGSSGFGLASAGVSSGFFVLSRVNNTDARGYKNGSLYLTNSGSNVYLPTFYVYIGNINAGGSPGTLYSSRRVSFASLGKGLTADQIRAYNTIVEKYNDALSR